MGWTPSSSPRHRIAAPMPSPSLIAMQKRGLELPFRQPDQNWTGETDLSNQKTSVTMLATATDFLPESPTGSCLTRSSSIYTTESASSTDSIETTISQIVDMYTDLISKIPSFDEEFFEPQIVQPEAYRDTVAPLLRQRFSAELYPLAATSDPMIKPISASSITKKRSEASLTSSYRQAPGFQEFSRNLRDRRQELVSPLSASSTSYSPMPQLKGGSQVSPITPPPRSFSWMDDETDGAVHVTSPQCPSRHKATRGMNTLDPVSVSRSQSRKANVKFSDPLKKPALQQPQSAEPLRYIESRDIFQQEGCFRPRQHEKVPNIRQRQLADKQEHQNRPEKSTLDGDFVIHNGVNEMMRARRRLENTKGKADEKIDAAHPSPRRSPQRSEDHSDSGPRSQSRKRTGLKQGVDAVVRKLSVSASNSTVSRPETPKQTEMPPLNPSTALSRSGAASPTTSKPKERRKEQRQSQGLGSPSKKNLQPRPKSYDTFKPGHRKTSSTKTVDVIRPPPSPAKRHGLMAVLEGAKHSLTHSSAEKRREKLKGSIVFVGPTELTLANANINGQAFSQVGYD